MVGCGGGCHVRSYRVARSRVGWVVPAGRIVSLGIWDSVNLSFRFFGSAQPKSTRRARIWYSRCPGVTHTDISRTAGATPAYHGAFDRAQSGRIDASGQILLSLITMVVNESKGQILLQGRSLQGSPARVIPLFLSGGKAWQDGWYTYH